MRFTPRALLPVFLLVLLLLGACSEKKEEPTGGVCAARVNCPNERAPAKVEECSDAAYDPTCGDAYRAYFACFQRNQVCDGRGLLDEDASAARCAVLAEAYGNCVTPVTDSGETVDTQVEDTGSTEDTRSAEDTKSDAATED